MYAFRISALITTAWLFSAPGLWAKGLDDMPPPAKTGASGPADATGTTEGAGVADGLTPTPSPNPSPSLQPSAGPTPAEASKPPNGEEKLAVESKPEPSRTERRLADNLVLGTSVNMVWADRPGSGWKSSGSGRTGGADLMVGMNVPNSALNLRKSKKLRLKGTFRFNPLVVAGTYESLPYRGVWQGYHAGLEAHLKEASFKGWTAVAGLEAGVVFVYLQALDEFETPTSAETAGAIVSAHAGGDWEVTRGIKVGPRVYFGFGSFQNYQLGAATHFSF